LAVETRDGIANGIVEVACGFNLEAGEDGDNLAIGCDDRGGDVFAGTVFREKFEKGGVAKVFFEVGAVV